MRLDKKAKRQSGSALAIVMVLLAVMMVFGVGMISVSTNRAMLTNHAITEDKKYYAAETAAQVYAQALMRKIEEEPERLGLAAGENEHIDMVVARFYGELQDRLDELHEYLKSEAASEFNGESVELEKFDRKDFEEFIEPGNKDTTTGDIAYLLNPVFLISVKSGSRNVIAEVPVVTVAKPPVGGKGKLKDIGGVFGDKAGGIYGDGSSNYNYYLGVYDEFTNTLINEYKVMEEAWKNPGFPSDFSSRALNVSGAGNDTDVAIGNIKTANSINAWGALQLGKDDGQVHVYQAEYIKTGSALTIRGKVEFPNLKGIIAGGMTTIKENTVITSPKLQLFNAQGQVLTVEKGSSIHAMTVDENGKVTDRKIPLCESLTIGSGSSAVTLPSGTTSVYCSTLRIHCDKNANTEINWCRFYATSGIEVYYNNGGKFITNSMFHTNYTIKLEGTPNSDVSRVVPQYYIGSGQGNLNISKLNTSVIAGIFITKGNGFLFNEGGGFNPMPEFVGLFVGNCDAGPAVGNANNKPIGEGKEDDLVMKDFDPDTSELMMDSNRFINDSDVSSGDGQPATVTAVCNKGVTIREGKK